MTWRTDPPKGRVFALVLIHGTTTPFVGQYEPGLKEWIGYWWGALNSWRSEHCTWHPLPPHPHFDSSTHAME